MGKFYTDAQAQEAITELKRKSPETIEGMRSIALRSLLLSFLLLDCVVVTAANAGLKFGGLGPICISVFDVAQDLEMKERNDLGERVSSAVRVELRSASLDRNVWAAPECIKVNQPGFDRQFAVKF